MVLLILMASIDAPMRTKISWKVIAAGGGADHQIFRAEQVKYQSGRGQKYMWENTRFRLSKYYIFVWDLLTKF